MEFLKVRATHKHGTQALDIVVPISSILYFTHHSGKEYQVHFIPSMAEVFDVSYASLESNDIHLLGYIN